MKTVGSISIPQIDFVFQRRVPRKNFSDFIHFFLFFFIIDRAAAQALRVFLMPSAVLRRAVPSQFLHLRPWNVSPGKVWVDFLVFFLIQFCMLAIQNIILRLLVPFPFSAILLETKFQI